MKRLLYLTILLSFVATPNAFVSDKNWNGESKYAEGYSDWSTTNNCPNKDTCVRQYIYLPVKEWSDSKTVSESEWKNVTIATGSGSVVKKGNSKKLYYGFQKASEGGCPDNFPDFNGFVGNAKRYTQSVAMACGDCDLGRRTNESFCSKEKEGAICFKDTTTFCTPQMSKDRVCREGVCKIKPVIEGGCNFNITDTVDHNCGVHSTEYYVQTSSLFKDVTKQSNWKKSLSDANGYAKKVAVYSYPLNFKVNFHGEGSNGTCTFERDLTECSIF